MATELAKFGDSLSETSDPSNVCQKVRPKFGRTEISVKPKLNFGRSLLIGT